MRSLHPSTVPLVRRLARFLGRLAFVLVAALLLAERPAIAQVDPLRRDRKQEEPGVHPVTGRKIARVMGVGGAAWLERRSRDEEERPEVVIAAMDLKKDSIVADIGCGTGYFSRRIAPEIPDGKVLGVEIQQEMLDLLMNMCEEAGIENIVPVLGEPNDPKLPAGGVDRMLLVDVYHEFQEPQEMLAKMREALRDDGMVALVEYRLLGDTARHIKLEHRMSVEQVVAEWTPAGFQLVKVIEELPQQHLFLFRKGEKSDAKPPARGLPFAP